MLAVTVEEKPFSHQRSLYKQQKHLLPLSARWLPGNNNIRTFF